MVEVIQFAATIPVPHYFLLMKRSRMQSKEILDWYKKRCKSKVKRNSLYLPEELKQQEKAKTIFDTLDKEGNKKVSINKLHNVCLKGGMHLNQNQAKLLFEPFDQDRSMTINYEEFEDSILNEQKREEFTVRAKKIHNQTGIPISYNSLLDHLCLITRRVELTNQIQNRGLSTRQKFEKAKELVSVQYNPSLAPPKSPKSPKRFDQQKLSELKKQYEGPKMDDDINEFVTQMNTQMEMAKNPCKKQVTHSICTAPPKPKILSFKHHTSLPQISQSEHHSCWNRSLNQIDSMVQEKAFKMDESNKKLNTIQKLKLEAAQFMKKARRLYHIQFDYVNEKQQSINEGRQTGSRSFEESLLSIMPPHPPALNNMTNLSAIKKDDRLNQSGDHLPVSLLRKLQQFKQITRDTSQMDRSIVSTYSKNSRIITPNQYQMYTNTDSQTSHNDSTFPKKRVSSYQDVKYKTPNFKSSDFQLPALV